MDVMSIKLILRVNIGRTKMIRDMTGTRGRIIWRVYEHTALGLLALKTLRKKYFDIAFLLHQSWTRSLLIYLAGVPVRVGYDFKKRGKLLTHKVELPEGMPHRSDHYLNVIESYGVKVKDRSCELAVLPEAKMAADRLLAKANIFPHDKVVMVNTGGNWDLKRFFLRLR